MAQPENDLDKQKRRHAGPLIGMGVLVALVLAGFVWWVGYAVDTSDEPAPGEAVETGDN